MSNAASPTLLTVKQFPVKHPAFSEGSLRFQIFNAKPRKTSRGEIAGNGLESALVRLGRKVMIDEAKFFEWLDRQNGHAAVETRAKAGGWSAKRANGVLHDLAEMTDDERYGVLVYLRRLAAERDA